MLTNARPTGPDNSPTPHENNTQPAAEPEPEPEQTPNEQQHLVLEWKYTDTDETAYTAEFAGGCFEAAVACIIVACISFTAVVVAGVAFRVKARA